MEEIGLIVLVTVICVLLIAVLRKVFSRNSSDDEVMDFTASAPEVTPAPTVEQIPERWFTLAELREAESGRYSWDESGCVFIVNADGSVTVAGRFDPAELLVNPVQEMNDKLREEDLIEMLPAYWSFHPAHPDIADNDLFMLGTGDDFLSFPMRSAAEVDILMAIISDNGKSEAISALSAAGEGTLILMPANEMEYILSLGANACIARLMGPGMRVIITSPAVMGAMGVAISRKGNSSARISFACGQGVDYMCCNLLVDDGVYEVKKLLKNSVIQPADPSMAIQHIAKGAVARTLTMEGKMTDCLLLDMITYPMSLLLKANGQVIKIYDYFNESVTIPAREAHEDISIAANQTLSFLIGSNELIDDVLALCGLSGGVISAEIALDANMYPMLTINSNQQNFEINIGELIG